MRRAFSLLLALAFGCGETSAPAEETPTMAAAAVDPEVVEEEDEEPFVEHTLERGQTLWDVARAYGVTQTAIVEANGLRPRDLRRLSVGRVLRIPGASGPAEVTRVAPPPRVEDLPEPRDGAYHVLAAGETLWDQ
ncbi:MAG: LysM peptidoglycan-binding domain-containing protein [Myxococcales bacterium]|nr:LysM peptidoglycan-binding domain-containing protein [Myxococcales bacterium]